MTPVGSFTVNIKLEDDQMRVINGRLNRISRAYHARCENLEAENLRLSQRLARLGNYLAETPGHPNDPDPVEAAIHRIVELTVALRHQRRQTARLQEDAIAAWRRLSGAGYGRHDDETLADTLSRALTGADS